MEPVKNLIEKYNLDIPAYDLNSLQSNIVLKLLDEELEKLSGVYSEFISDLIKVYQSNIDYKINYLNNFNVINDISSRIERIKYKKSICIYCFPNSALGKWDPSSIETGIPGSEESVIYASNILANLGYDVTIEASPPLKSIWNNIHSNPRYIQIGNNQYDILIAWRRFDLENFKNKAKKIYFWAHDVPCFNTQYKITGIDGIFLLSNYHYNLFKNNLSIPYTICGNGVVLDDFKNPINFENPYSCGYYSNYGRGLDIILNIWSDIKITYPQATLDIYYGRNTYGTLRDDQLKSITDKIAELSDLNVYERGLVGHRELAKAMCNTSLWLYPCNNYSETFCITAIKAQLAGMIPITTRMGALNETVCDEAFTMDSIFNLENIDRYKNMVLDVMKNINYDYIKEKRLKCIEFASNYTWDRCVNKWIDMFNLNSNDIKEEPKKSTVIIKMNNDENNLLTDKDLLIVIFANNNEKTINLSLECIYKLDYPKDKIRIYFKCYDSHDNTENLIIEWIEKNNQEYKSIILDTNLISGTPKELMDAKNFTLQYAIDNNCDYFFISPLCFLYPDVINQLYQSLLTIASPLLKVNTSLYSNYNYEITNDGYFKNDTGIYIHILNQTIKGIIEVKAIKYCYLIDYDYLNDCMYDNYSCPYEYMNFSMHLIKNNIPQYIDNRKVGGKMYCPDIANSYIQNYNQIFD